MEKIRQFMYGRYGQIDNLNKFLLLTGFILYLVAAILSRFTAVGLFINILSSVMFVLAIVRMLSKQVYKRSAENLKYMELKTKIAGKFGKNSSNTYGYGSSQSRDKSYKQGATTAKVRPVRDPAYKYFKCRKCKKIVRVPINHGKVELTCKNCGHTFVRFTGKRQKK